MKSLICLLALLCPLISVCQQHNSTGYIYNTRQQPIAHATVTLLRTGQQVQTNSSGRFIIANTYTTDSVRISAVGYTATTIICTPNGNTIVQLQEAITELDETVVIAYGQTTRRFNTGNIGQVTAKELSSQPVSNPLAALAGRVPGLVITQNSGIPGGAYGVQIRGQSSLTQGSEPLFIIDGMPFGNGNSSLNQYSLIAASGGLSPLNMINAADIESIEVLKDADATAIYGSRGANGVILVTTKKGTAGKTNIQAGYRSGFSRVTRSMNMLNTSQYLAMRREAFANDGVVPTSANAPDLLVWDTTRYTDFKKMFTGGTTRYNDLQLSASGGTAFTRFNIGLGYNQETGMMNSKQGSKRLSLHSSLQHNSVNKKLLLGLIVSYNYNKSDLLSNDLTAYINLPPHLRLYDDEGNLNWLMGNASMASFGGGITNPLSLLRRTYDGRFSNAMFNLSIRYNLFKNLQFTINEGVQLQYGNESSLLPKVSIDPALATLASSVFVNTQMRNLQTEPQLEYNFAIPDFTLQVLAGGTLQERVQQTNTLNANNYTSDLLLESWRAAGQLTGANIYSQYKYAALFSRIHINYRNSWILNLTGRRDGSSRFGPAQRFSNFGAVGLAHIFSEWKWIKKHLGFLSFGKWRASYGVTGNDQIGDYRYLDTWSSTPLSYQGAGALMPGSLYNPAFAWERNKKWELALELAFLQSRILFNTAYFLHRSDNQLSNYALPVITGFTGVLSNMPAVIENRGWELVLQSKNIQRKNLQWNTSVNLSIPRNKLVAFDNLANSSYSNVYVIGQPLSVQKTYEYLGVDPEKGVYRFTDVDRNGIMDNADKIKLVNTALDWYGGMRNTITWKGLSLDFFAEFRKQTGRNYLATQSNFIPGYFYLNQPAIVLNRWQQPGDISPIQRFVPLVTSAGFTPAQSWLAESDGIYSDASFIRIKNLSFAYNLPGILLKRAGIQQLQFTVQAQNLFTITRYKGADPENQNLYVLPPLRTISFGIQLQF